MSGRMLVTFSPSPHPRVRTLRTMDWPTDFPLQLLLLLIPRLFRCIRSYPHPFCLPLFAPPLRAIAFLTLSKFGLLLRTHWPLSHLKELYFPTGILDLVIKLVQSRLPSYGTRNWVHKLPAVVVAFLPTPFTLAVLHLAHDTHSARSILTPEKPWIPYFVLIMSKK